MSFNSDSTIVLTTKKDSTVSYYQKIVEQAKRIIYKKAAYVAVASS